MYMTDVDGSASTQNSCVIWGTGGRLGKSLEKGFGTVGEGWKVLAKTTGSMGRPDPV